MSASEQLYDGLDTWLSQCYCWRDQRHLQILIYMVRLSRRVTSTARLQNRA